MVTNLNTSYPDYIFEVRLAGTKRSAQEFYHQGKHFIEGRKGSEYELFFRNRSSRRVLVVMSVDGLSIMDGKAAGIKSGGYVVGAYCDITVPGWTLDANKVAKFQFRPQGDSQDATYVEALKADGIAVDTGNQGVIGCLVFPEKPYIPPMRERYSTGYITNTAETFRSLGLHQASTRGYVDSGPPTDAVAKGINTMNICASASLASQPSNATLNSTFIGAAVPESPLGTGMGDDQSFATRKVEFEREDAANPAWKTFIVYDTLKGLQKRGVPVYSTVKEDLDNAFPASPELTTGGCYVPRNRR